MKLVTRILAAVAASSALASGSALAQLSPLAACYKETVEEINATLAGMKSSLSRKRITATEYNSLLADHKVAVELINNSAKHVTYKAPGPAGQPVEVHALVYPSEAACKATKDSNAKLATRLATLANKPPARWEKTLAAIQTLSHEGAEVRRINAAEAKNIADNVTKIRALIKDKAQGGLTEEEEESVDVTLSSLTETIAKYMSDVARKQAAATPAGTATAAGAAGAAAAASPWIAVAANGTTPTNAVEGGGSAAVPLHVCRAKGADGFLRPGKAYKNNCYIYDSDKENKVDAFEALVMKDTVWVAAAAGGASPAKAVEGAPAFGGAPVHICRAKMTDNLMHAGMAYKGTCYVGLGGKGIKSTAFEVLATK